MTKHIDPARTELAAAIAEVTKADESAKKSQAEVDRAADHLRAMQLAHGRVTAALEEATAPPKTLEEKLKGAYSVDEQLDIVDEHNASLIREPLTAEDLKRLRQAAADAADALTIARRGLEVAEARASPMLSALNRAKNRRQRAVYEVSRPEVGRLMREAQALVEQLGAKRAELSYVANSLVNPLEGDRREASFFLNQHLLWPEEGGLKSGNDLTRRDGALAAWTQFADAITRDATVPFPGSD